MKDDIIHVLVKIALRLHNFFYRASSRLAIKAEGGLHPKHRLTGYHQFFSDNIRPGDTVIDIGCGNGALSFLLAEKAGKVVAVDMNELNLRTAREQYAASNIEYLAGDVTEYDFQIAADVIVMSNVLEHIKDRVQFLKGMKNLSPKMLIRVPMINRDWITVYKKEQGVEWRSDKTHYTEYTLQSFREELKQADLHLEDYSIQFGEIWAIALSRE